MQKSRMDITSKSMDRSLRPKSAAQHKAELESTMKHSGPSVRATAAGLAVLGGASAKGSLAGGVQIAKKAAAPVAAATMAMDVARLAVNPDARKIATKTAETRAKSSAIVRAGKAALDPVNTIYGVASQANQAVRSWRNGKNAEASYLAAKQRFDRKRAQ